MSQSDCETHKDQSVTILEWLRLEKKKIKDTYLLNQNMNEIFFVRLVSSAVISPYRLYDNFTEK